MASSQSLGIKFIMLLQAVRWYNVTLMVIAQYILAFFVFGEATNWAEVLVDRKLHLIVISTSFALAGAFLINAFYDVDKDLVNKSQAVLVVRFLGQNFLLNSYAGFNALAVLLAMLASMKVFGFVALLILMFWFYSHKLQKIPLIREISATLLAVAPLVAVWLHFAELHYGMFLYLGALVVLEFTREVVKDLEGNKGNIIFGYTTVVVAAGTAFTKTWLIALNVLFLVLWILGSLNFMTEWGYYSSISLFAVLVALLVSLIARLGQSVQSYAISDSLLKAAIVIHLLSPVIRIWM